MLLYTIRENMSLKIQGLDSIMHRKFFKLGYSIVTYYNYTRIYTNKLK